MTDLRQRTELFSNALPFMEGRDKGNLNTIKEKPVTIIDYGFLGDGNDEYVGFIIDEDPNNFYFGGMVLTENLKALDNEGFGLDIRTNGLPVMFNDKTGKNNRTYTSVTYYPKI